MDDSAVFLDTSIMIARFVHGPRTKQRIRERLERFKLTVTGTVVRQEFRRRLLKEAQYILKLLDRPHISSIADVLRHVVDVLPKQQDRKRQICFQTLVSVFENSPPSEQTARLRLFLKSLLKGGLDEFDELVDHVVEASKCAAGRQPVTEKKSKKYDFGSDKCSALSSSCGIAEFVRDRSDSVERIRSHLSTCGTDQTREIAQTASFIKESATGPIEEMNPCLVVGDYLIALESAGIPTMYTMNGRESQYFCKALEQTMIVQRPNPDHEDVICRAGDDWPAF